MEASHKTSMRSVRKKTRRKTSMLKLQSVKCKEVLQERLLLRLQHVPSQFSSFLLPSRCLWGKLQNLSLSKASKQAVNVVSHGRRGTLQHSNCFMTCQKPFCVAGTVLPHFQTMRCILRGRRSTLDTCHFAWQAQHFRRVVLRVFCKSHCQRCAKW